MLLSKMKLQISFVRENTKRNNLFISSNFYYLNVGIYILCSHQITLSLEIKTDHALEENYLSDLQKNGSAGILHSVFYGYVFVGLVIYFRTHSRAAVYICMAPNPVQWYNPQALDHQVQKPSSPLKSSVFTHQYNRDIMVIISLNCCGNCLIVYIYLKK